jgi:hemerythrin-like domain-containing protein
MDHDEIDRHLDELITAFETGDRDAAAAAFRAAEHLLLAHFDLEERLLFPEFAAIEPAETEELRREHREIRTKLEELAIGVDLHATRLSAIRELVQWLRRHAEREHELLYNWADRYFADPALYPALETFFARGRSPAAPAV